MIIQDGIGVEIIPPTSRRRVPTPTTRELACLALGHADADRAACTATDDELMRELIEEVQALHRLLDRLLTPEATR